MTSRDLSFASFDEVRSELDRLRRTGYDRAGEWDLAQICDHLHFFMSGTLDGHRFKVPWLLKALLGRIVLKRILRQRRMKPGVFTPQKPLPSPGGDEAAAVSNFKNTINRFESYRGEYVDSPFFGHLTPDQWRELHLIHAAHHLAHLIPKA